MYPADTFFRAVVGRATGGAVHGGPFKGLLLAPHPILPHLLGTYELELHAVAFRADDGDDFTVLWPPDFDGEFTVE